MEILITNELIIKYWIDINWIIFEMIFEFEKRQISPRTMRCLTNENCHVRVFENYNLVTHKDAIVARVNEKVTHVLSSKCWWNKLVEDKKLVLPNSWISLKMLPISLRKLVEGKKLCVSFGIMARRNSVSYRLRSTVDIADWMSTWIYYSFTPGFMLK